jgi:Glucosidase II beta subunit-like protein/Glucosidase II beta subunit-like
MNDGYCDCPYDGGIDEPNTSACAGMETWPHSVDVAATTTESPLLYYTCPQQPGLQIPPSRVHDGICDCCDGADEKVSGTSRPKCPDKCAAIHAAARAALEKVRKQFQVGQQQRSKDLQLFANEVALQQEASKTMQQEQETLQASIEVLQQQVFQLKDQQLYDRLVKVRDRFLAAATSSKSSLGLLDGLTTNDQLASFIRNTCQLAGEITSDSDQAATTSDQTKTCIPLRLAGLDAGIWWESSTYQVQLVDLGEKAADDAVVKRRRDLAAMLDYNLQSDQPIWVPNERAIKKRERRSHRRLEEIPYEDYETHDDQVDDYQGDYEDDEPDANDDLDTVASDSADSTSSADKREEVLSNIKSQPLSRSRVSLLNQASILLDRIRAADAAVDADNESSNETESPKIKTSIDPMAFPMLTNTLERRQRIVNRGFDYAVSAHVLLEKLDEYFSADGTKSDDKRKMLQMLAVGTAYHSNLSTVQIWQVLRETIPELATSAVPDVADPETCRSTWQDVCPPQQVTLATGVKVPSDPILAAAKAFCAHQLDPAVTAAVMKNVCSANAASASADASHIPLDIPDGFAGYYEVRARDDNDFLKKYFVGVELQDGPSREEITKASTALSDKEAQKTKLDQDLRKAQELIEARDSGKYGPDGELYAIRDECFSVDEGKYTYEVCMFKEAKQKDKGVKHGGTGLGTWTEASFDEKEGKRVWSWSGGAHCWNGPARSATAYVSCGETTQVLSADEPDTCRYVLEMKSPVACDESYRLKHGL